MMAVGEAPEESGPKMKDPVAEFRFHADNGDLSAALIAIDRMGPEQRVAAADVVATALEHADAEDRVRAAARALAEAKGAERMAKVQHTAARAAARAVGLGR